jgi:CubicO group peptidase (beta-lactamase class C family)
MTSTLRGVRAHLASFADTGYCLGGQIFVWHDGEVLADEGIGHCAPGRVATADVPGQLQCALKPLVTCCLARAAERGLICLDDRVARWIPAFRGGRKDRVTLRALLSHTSGLPSHPVPDCYALDFTSFIEMICQRRIDDAWWHDDAIYNMCWAWHLLAGVLEQVHGASIGSILETEVSAALNRPGLTLTGLETGFARYWKWQAPGQFAEVAPVDRETFQRRPNPAYGGVGTMADLGHFYIDLLHCVSGTGRLLTAESMRDLTSQHSMVRYNPGGAARPFGLGFFLAGSAGDLAGPWSPGCFGHIGSIFRHYNICAFAEPATRTVAAVRLFSLSTRNNRWFRQLGRVLATDLGASPSGR